MLDFSVTLAITIFNIAFLTFVLKKILFKPVSRFMAERAKRVRDSIEDARIDRAKAQELLEHYQEKLKDAHIEAEKIIKDARENAKTQAGRIVADGKIAAEALAAEARVQIDLEWQKAVARFGMEAVALVMAASSRLSQREFSGSDSRIYADMLLSELAVHPGLQKGKE